MTVPPSSELHFRTRLLLEPDGSRDPQEIRGELRDIVRRWLVAKVGERDAPSERDFRADLKAILMGHRIQYAVRSVHLPGTRPRRELWAFRVEYPDERIERRSWALNVALSPSGDEGATRFSVRLRHWLPAGHVGARPALPEPGPPSFLWRIAGVRGTRPFLEGRPLELRVRELDPGGGREFVEELKDPVRPPLVYMSLSRRDGAPALNPQAVRKAVAFAGSVVVASSLEVDEELDHLLPPDLRCVGGAVRLYLPGVEVRPSGEGRRHRYIPLAQLRENSERWALTELSTGAARALPLEDPREEPVFFDEVERRLGEARLEVLRGEVEDLRGRARGGLSAEEARRLLDLVDELERSRDALERDARELSETLFRLQEESAAEEERAEAGVEPAAASGGVTNGAVARGPVHRALEELPQSLSEVLSLAEALYPDRLVVTERARKSAADASLEDPRVGWRMLRAMATDLHPLHFGGSQEEVPARAAEGARVRRRPAETRVPAGSRAGTGGESASFSQGEEAGAAVAASSAASSSGAVSGDAAGAAGPAAVPRDASDGPAPGAAEIARRFRDRTGFDLGVTETAATKGVRRLMALREMEWEGRTIDLRLHVKWGGRPPKVLRVHYWPDPDGRRLVLGHVGDHLETIGTSRM